MSDPLHSAVDATRVKAASDSRLRSTNAPSPAVDRPDSRIKASGRSGFGRSRARRPGPAPGTPHLPRRPSPRPPTPPGRGRRAAAGTRRAARPPPGAARRRRRTCRGSYPHLVSGTRHSGSRRPPQTRRRCSPFRSAGTDASSEARRAHRVVLAIGRQLRVVFVGRVREAIVLRRRVRRLRGTSR